MYILNDDRLKNRSPFLTWLFFNKKLQKDCAESIPLLVGDIDKLYGVETRAHEIKDIRSELKLSELQKGMTVLYMECVKAKHRILKSRLTFDDVLSIVLILRTLDKTLSE
jgi:hypothetical protein